MRSVYRNVGETDDLVGLYPFAPLHDMRRALQTLDPRKTRRTPTPRRATSCATAILQSFYALRETFLEELDLEEPDRPLLISGGRRTKKSGSTGRARRDAEPPARAAGPRSRRPIRASTSCWPSSTTRRMQTAKPWRQPAGDGQDGTPPAPNGRAA